MLVSQSYPILVTPWTVARQAPLSMGLSMDFPWVAISSSGDLSSAGREHLSPASAALAGGLFTTKSPGKPVK